jgi:aspartate/tyrosine/aromatic aminotransferase
VQQIGSSLKELLVASLFRVGLIYIVGIVVVDTSLAAVVVLALQASPSVAVAELLVAVDFVVVVGDRQRVGRHSPMLGQHSQVVCVVGMQDQHHYYSSAAGHTEDTDWKVVVESAAASSLSSLGMT